MIEYPEEYLEALGTSFSDAMSKPDVRPSIEGECFKNRAEWLTRLGLDPNKTEDWLTPQDDLVERERTLVSLQATGFPDTDLSTARMAIEIADTIREVQSFNK